MSVFVDPKQKFLSQDSLFWAGCSHSQMDQTFAPVG